MENRARGFELSVETGFRHVGQASLEILTSDNLRVSAFQSSGMTGMSHHAQPTVGIFALRRGFTMLTRWSRSLDPVIHLPWPPKKPAPSCSPTCLRMSGSGFPAGEPDACPPSCAPLPAMSGSGFRSWASPGEPGPQRCPPRAAAPPACACLGAASGAGRAQENPDPSDARPELQPHLPEHVWEQLSEPGGRRGACARITTVLARSERSEAARVADEGCGRPSWIVDSWLESRLRIAD
ncbi:Protein GVQW1 [Plecturocebus cupreus]